MGIIAAFLTSLNGVLKLRFLNITWSQMHMSGFIRKHAWNIIHDPLTYWTVHCCPEKLGVKSQVIVLKGKMYSVLEIKGEWWLLISSFWGVKETATCHLWQYTGCNIYSDILPYNFPVVHHNENRQVNAQVHLIYFHLRVTGWWSECTEDVRLWPKWSLKSASERL